jgi:hypothetical protein
MCHVQDHGEPARDAGKFPDKRLQPVGQSGCGLLKMVQALAQTVHQRQRPIRQKQPLMRCADELVDQALIVVVIVGALAIPREAGRAHHQRQEPLQQPVAGQAVQLDQLRRLDAANQAH